MRRSQTARVKSRPAAARVAPALLPSLFVYASALTGKGDTTALAMARTWHAWARAHASSGVRDGRSAEPSGPHLDADPTTFAEAQIHGDPGRAIRAIVTVAGAGPRVRHRRPRSDADAKMIYSVAQTFTLSDREGERIDTLPVVDASLVALLTTPAVRDHPLEIEAVLLALPKTTTHAPARPFVLFLIAARPARSRLAQLSATKKEISETKAWLAEMTRKRKAPLDVVRKATLEHLGIVGLARFPELADTLDAVILQAFSGGRVGKSTGCLHVMALGAAASGKQFLSDVAKLLNAETVELLASGLTEAALIGPTRPTQSGWTHEPGFLQRANDGVLSIQDVQAMLAGRASALSDTFQSVMTTGALPPGKVGTEGRVFSVRVLMDGNPDPFVSIDRRAPGRPRAPRFHEQAPMLGRFDLLAVFPSDLQRAWEIAFDMVDAAARPSQAAKDGEARRLALLVAMLHERHPSIDLSRVGGAVRAAADEMREYILAHAEKLPAGAFQPARTILTLLRFTAAIARANDRARAKDEDLRLAARLTWHRVHAIEKLATLARAADAVPVAEGEPAWRGRLTAIVRACGGEIVTIPQIEALLDEAGEATSRSGIVRDLDRLRAKKAAYGRYRIPKALFD